MAKTTSLFVVVLLGATLLPARAAQSSELPDRPSLAGVRAVGQIIVTMAAGSRENVNAVRQVIERRLEAAGIAIDPTQSARLVADVQVARSTSPSGEKLISYLVGVAFQEPVRVERSPGTIFMGTSWAGNSTLRRYNAEMPFEAVLDAVDNKVSGFLRAVAKDAEDERVRTRPAASP